MRRTMAIGGASPFLCTLLVASLAIVACSSDPAPAAVTPADDGGATTTSDGSRPPPGPRPAQVRIVNNFTQGGVAFCIKAGADLLTTDPIQLDLFADTILELPPYDAARLVTDPITVVGVFAAEGDNCADREVEGFPLPAIPAGAFNADKSYLLLLSGCELGLTECVHADEMGKVVAGPPPRVAAAIEIDTSPVSPDAVGFQFVNGSLVASDKGNVIDVEARAVGGWEDGPKSIGGPVGFGQTVVATPATPALIPTLGFFPPSAGQVSVVDVEGNLIADAISVTAENAPFVAGKSYVIVNVGQAPKHKLLVFQSSK